MNSADLILTGGNLLTMNPARPRATAMAVRDGRITGVGDDRAIEALAAPDARQIDLRGKTVIPGFCDAHVHLFWHGRQLLRQADLVGAADIDNLLDRLSRHASRTSGWIEGHGFDQDKLRERRFPTRQDLDRVSTTRPIIISRICGHACIVNSAALAMVSPAERDAGDAQAGLYTEDDCSPFHARIPPLEADEAEQAVLTAANVALRTGITSVHALLDTPDQMAAYARLHRKGKLPLRVVGIPPAASVGALHDHGILTGFGDDMLRFGACKFFSDGSLGAQTALLSQPYADKPQTLGIRVYDPRDLKDKARNAQRNGFQLAIHAIGDQAVRETLDAIEYALDGEDNRAWRHRIEHASMVAPDCMQRLARLGVVVTIQPQFVTSDTWTPDRIGPGRVPWAYPFRSMLCAGVPIALSSDCPVEKLDAFACLSSVTLRHAWSPDETLSIEEAMQGYCLGGAYAAGMEDRLGSLEAGKLADFVVLSADPTRLDPMALQTLSAERVFVGGQERTVS